MSRPRKIQNIDEENSEMDSKTHIFVRTISKSDMFTESGAKPSSVVENEIDEWKSKGYKITFTSLVETVPEGPVLLVLLEKE